MAARRVRSAARLAGPFIVTEDEALVLLDIEVSLVEAGFEVISARNGTQALSAFDAEPARFKAVVTDIRLGMARAAGILAATYGAQSR
jgi:DNA-binding NtrC family response regulator